MITTLLPVWCLLLPLFLQLHPLSVRLDMFAGAGEGGDSSSLATLLTFYFYRQLKLVGVLAATPEDQELVTNLFMGDTGDGSMLENVGVCSTSGTLEFAAAGRPCPFRCACRTGRCWLVGVVCKVWVQLWDVQPSGTAGRVRDWEHCFNAVGQVLGRLHVGGNQIVMVVLSKWLHSAVCAPGGPRSLQVLTCWAHCPAHTPPAVQTTTSCYQVLVPTATH